MCRCQKIRELNDLLRTTFFLKHGRVMITASVDAQPVPLKARIIERIKAFDDFTPENDPHKEHDFGSVEVDAQTVFFKIDYYDVQLVFDSDDPADPAKTTRVLTIMLSVEY